MNLFTTLAQSEQHVYGFEGTTAAAIFIAGFTGLLILAALTVKINFRLLILAATLFATALTAPVDYVNMSFISTWMLPVQRLRAEIHLGLGILLTLLVVAPGNIGLGRISFQGILMLLMGLYMALLQYVHEDATEATKSLVFALATIPCMVVAVPQLTRTHDQCLALLRMIMMVSIVWTFCCSVQFVINPKHLVNGGGRFWGMLANAQQAAILVAPFCIIALWLILHDPQRRTKILWITLLAINLLFLMWTGSRTGALMLVVGAAGVLYTRIGRAIALLPLAAIMFWGLWYLSDLLQIGSSVERLVSSENTREGVWSRQIEAALSSPLFGIGWTEAIGGSESSYLGGFAAYGIVFLLLVLTLLFGSMAFCIGLMRNRRVLPEHDRPLVDIFVAFNAMLFGGAAFEGYLVARSSSALTMMLMFVGIGVYLRETLAERIAESRLEHPVDGYDTTEWEHAGENPDAITGNPA